MKNNIHCYFHLLCKYSCIYIYTYMYMNIHIHTDTCIHIRHVPAYEHCCFPLPLAEPAGPRFKRPEPPLLRPLPQHRVGTSAGCPGSPSMVTRTGGCKVSNKEQALAPAIIIPLMLGLVIIYEKKENNVLGP